MRNQLYTNAILTVIAAALVYLCIVQTALPPTVRADSQTYSVPVLKGACATCPGGPQQQAAVPVVVLGWNNPNYPYGPIDLKPKP